MHIAVVCWKYHASAGIPNHIRAFISRLKQNIRITIFCIDGSQDNNEENVKFISVKRGNNVFLKIYYFFLELKRVYKKDPFDLIHCHDSEAFFSCYYFRGLKKVSICFTLHASIFEKGRSADYGQWTALKYRFTERFSVNHASKVIAISKCMENCALSVGVDKGRISIIPGYLEDNNFVKKCTSNKKKNGLFVGYLRPVKGVEYLIQSMKLICQEIPDFKLIIVGDGDKDYKEKLTELINRLELRGSIEMVGHKSKEEIKSYYVNAGLFFVPSLSEPQGLVVLEAMAYGIPIIASNVGGIPEMIEDNTTGFLIQPKDYKGFAQKTLLVLKNDALHQKISKESWDYYQQLPDRSKSLLKVYQEMLKG